MPLVQAAQNKRDWLKIVGVLTVSMVLVTALFGAILGAPAAALAGFVGSKRAVSLIMQPTLIIVGLAMLVVALGEFGLIRRLLPEVHFGASIPQGTGDPAPRGSYRRAAIIGATMAATFGVICTKPLYVALLVYV